MIHNGSSVNTRDVTGCPEIADADSQCILPRTTSSHTSQYVVDSQYGTYINDSARMRPRASLPASPVPAGYWDFHGNNAISATKAGQRQVYTPFHHHKRTQSYGNAAETFPDNRYSSRVQQVSSKAASSYADSSSLSSSQDEQSISSLSSEMSATSLHIAQQDRLTQPEPVGRLNCAGKSLIRAHLPPLSTHGSRYTCRGSHSTAKLANKPGDAFRRLPRNVLDNILHELRKVHLYGGTSICSTCYMRDLCSLSRVNRQCSASARIKLYQLICLVGPDAAQRTRIFRKRSSRLKLLLRTLLENSHVASSVKELLVHDLWRLDGNEDEHDEKIASIVMACPNLERVTGLRLPFRQGFSKLQHAISSRECLREYCWVVSPASDSAYTGLNETAVGKPHDSMPDSLRQPLLMRIGTVRERLDMLAIHRPTCSIIDGGILSAVLVNLPALQRLALSHIDNLSPTILTELPALAGLHLSHIPTITSQVLSSWSIAPQMQALRSLSLIHIPLVSLPVLARLLHTFSSLRYLAIIQDISPTLPIDTAVYLQPYLSSLSLKHLTWDILAPGIDEATDASSILARSIIANGFPSLRTLTAPCDYTGALQAVCMPAHNMLQVSDSPLSGSTSSSCRRSSGALKKERVDKRKDCGVDGTQASLCFATQWHAGRVKQTRSLQHARFRAQARIEAARSRPSCMIIVTDRSTLGRDRFIASCEVGGYIGRVGTDCRIRYVLASDVDGKDTAGTVIEDIIELRTLDARTMDQERAFAGSDGSRQGTCDGSWNDRSAHSGKKDRRKKWHHVERERWSPVRLETLFGI